MTATSKAPVFIVGAARSGTTLLYHMVISGGDFVLFRAETHAYDVVGPRFAHLRSARWRERLMAEWLRTRHFEMSGLDARELTDRVVRECRCTGDFLRVFMEMMATAQGVGRWSDCTPAHVAHMRRIKQEIPDARFIHVIRDGRDVALSASRLGWQSRLPGVELSPVEMAAVAWRWAIRMGRRHARHLGRDYLEVRFEDLVRQPASALQQVGHFIDQPLDYDRIREVGLGSVSQPNTSFAGDANARFEPVGRFRNRMTDEQLAGVESVIGDTLDALGYARAATQRDSAVARLKGGLYDRYLTSKLLARVHTPLGRRTSLEALHTW